MRAALDTHIALTRAEPGCVSFHVTQTADPLVWQVSEVFEYPAAVEAQQARASASDWATQTDGIARDYTVTGMP